MLAHLRRWDHAGLTIGWWKTGFTAGCKTGNVQSYSFILSALINTGINSAEVDLQSGRGSKIHLCGERQRQVRWNIHVGHLRLIRDVWMLVWKSLLESLMTSSVQSSRWPELYLKTTGWHGTVSSGTLPAGKKNQTSRKPLPSDLFELRHFYVALTQIMGVRGPA